MNPMTSDYSDWETLEAALDELLDATSAERPSVLKALRARSEPLASRAEALLKLALDDTALPGNLGDVAPDLFSALTEEDVRVHLGERLGPYRVVEIISRGGMGIVFRGERADGSFEQSVAIKVIPASIAGESARATFRERAPVSCASRAPQHRPDHRRRCDEAGHTLLHHGVRRRCQHRCVRS